MQPDWQAWRASPVALPVLPLIFFLDELPADRWPDHADWSGAALARGVANLDGATVRFVAPSTPAASALDFERRIHTKGEVETRPASWHDAFHALAWLAFPQAKARINALHVAEGLDASPNGRSAVRNVLTLFDEGGLFVVSADHELLQLVREFKWHRLFWERRAEVRRHMDFVIFGHALFERTLAMDYGATGRALLFASDPAYFGWDSATRLDWLDREAAALLADPVRLTATTALQPVPINGIPGWNAQSDAEGYYRDVRQFAPGRRKVTPC